MPRIVLEIVITKAALSTGLGKKLLSFRVVEGERARPLEGFRLPTRSTRFRASPRKAL